MAFEFLDRWQHTGNDFINGVFGKIALVCAGIAATYFGIKWLGDKSKNTASTTNPQPTGSGHAGGAEALTPSPSPRVERPVARVR